MLLALDVVGLEQLFCNNCKSVALERCLLCEATVGNAGIDFVGNVLNLLYECECNAFARQLLFVAVAPETVVQVVVLNSTQLLYELETAVVVGQHKAVR